MSFAGSAPTFPMPYESSPDLAGCWRTVRADLAAAGAPEGVLEHIGRHLEPATGWALSLVLAPAPVR